MRKKFLIILSASLLAFSPVCSFADDSSEKVVADPIKSGMYKVGSDLPAGEYLLVSDSLGYFEISSDSTGSFSSIISNDTFDTNSIVEVYDGEYLSINGCKAYPIDEAPEIDTSKPGMFRVGEGKDLLPGEYKVHPESDIAYIEVSNDARHNFSSIVSNDLLSGDSYITVSEGQYIKLQDAVLIQ